MQMQTQADLKGNRNAGGKQTTEEHKKISRQNEAGNN